MKKLLALLCLLLALGLFAVCAIGAAVGAGRDEVTFTPRHIYGDPAAATGATVSLRARLDDHLMWNLNYPLGGEVTSDSVISMREIEFEGHPHIDGINMFEDIDYGLNIRTPLEDLVGIEVAYYELFRDTAPGTKGTATVRLQDCYTYYPLRIDIDLPGTLWHGLDYEDMASDDFANERAVWDAFREFFRIPIPADLPEFEISVVKNKDGSIGGVGSSAPKEGFHYNIYTEAAYTSDACFMTVNNRYGEGYVDTSLIPGGYGVYRFTYGNVRNETNTQGNTTVFHPGYVTGVHAESLAMVYPLEESIRVNGMFVTPDEKRLLLMCEDRAGAVSLTVIDIATMEEIQTIPVTEGVGVSLHQEEDFFVLFYDQNISVYALRGDGSYAHVLTGEQPYFIQEKLPSIHSGCAVDLDGERVIFVDFLSEPRYRVMQMPSICVAVYDAAGLLYYGEYDNSLAVNPHTMDYSYNVLGDELRVVW